MGPQASPSFVSETRSPSDAASLLPTPTIIAKIITSVILSDADGEVADTTDTSAESIYSVTKSNTSSPLHIEWIVTTICLLLIILIIGILTWRNKQYKKQSVVAHQMQNNENYLNQKIKIRDVYQMMFYRYTSTIP